MATLYCPQCGYNLTALTENRCPECGEGFDPARLEKLQRQTITTRSVVLHLVFAPLGFALIVSVLLLIVSLINWIDDMRGFVIGLAIIIIIAIFSHTRPLAQKVVQACQVRRGRMNTHWLFRSVLPCWILFTLTEWVLTVLYIIGCFTVINAIRAGF